MHSRADCGSGAGRYAPRVWRVNGVWRADRRLRRAPAASLPRAVASWHHSVDGRAGPRRHHRPSAACRRSPCDRAGRARPIVARTGPPSGVRRAGGDGVVPMVPPSRSGTCSDELHVAGAGSVPPAADRPRRPARLPQLRSRHLDRRRHLDCGSVCGGVRRDRGRPTARRRRRSYDLRVCVVRQGTTPPPTSSAATATSTTPRSPPSGSWIGALDAWQCSTWTTTTATAPSRSSTPATTCCSSRSTPTRSSSSRGSPAMPRRWARGRARAGT